MFCPTPPHLSPTICPTFWGRKSAHAGTKSGSCPTRPTIFESHLPFLQKTCMRYAICHRMFSFSHEGVFLVGQVGLVGQNARFVPSNPLTTAPKRHLIRPTRPTTVKKETK